MGPSCRFAGLFLVSALISGTLVACSGASASRSESAALSESPASDPQLLEFTYEDRPTVGADVQVTATNLPAGRTVDLMWATVTGGWVIEDYYRFRGKKYEPTRTSLGRFAIDARGRLDAHFTIPEDYGGMHDVIALVDGATVAQTDSK